MRLYFAYASDVLSSALYYLINRLQKLREEVAT